MNILERVQKLYDTVTTVFCLHNEESDCDRISRLSNHFDKQKQVPPRINNMIEDDIEEKDNFLRGVLTPSSRRRHESKASKVGISYWRHGSGCSCCKESHKSEDFQEMAPTSVYNKSYCSDLARSGYIDLTETGAELQCLTSFITASGRHRVVNEHFIQHPEEWEPQDEHENYIRRPKASDTLTRLAKQVRLVEQTIDELANDPDPIVRAVATEFQQTQSSDALDRLIETVSGQFSAQAESGTTSSIASDVDTSVSKEGLVDLEAVVESIVRLPKGRKRSEPTLENLPAFDQSQLLHQ